MCPGAQVVVPLLKKKQKKVVDPSKNQCTICSKSFAWPGRLARHMLSHTGERPHVCKVCNKGFTEQGHLQRHSLIHSGVRPYGCTMCTLRFIEKGTLKRHMLTHTGEKLHACKICKKKFGREENLKTHMFTHTGEKPRACTVCGQRFAQASTLQRHMSTHCTNPTSMKEPIMTKFIPPERTPNDFVLSKNEEADNEDVDDDIPILVDSKEGIKSPTKDPTPFWCRLCDNKFVQPGHLKVHMLMHALHLIPEEKEQDDQMTRPSSQFQLHAVLGTAC